MIATLDETHDADRRSWVVSANGHADFPLQNLPIGVGSPDGGEPRGVIAIGDEVLDLAAALQAGVFEGPAAEAARLAAAPPLNRFLEQGSGARRTLRTRIFALLANGAPEQEAVSRCLRPAATCAMRLPVTIGDYTDFYAGIHHALNVGRQFRPDQPLLPNYKYVPIGYHGRSSSIVVSGTAVRRPLGQRKGPDDPAPAFGPTRRLDFELELGFWVGPGNALGTPIPISEAADHIGGFCLLNDWSARDIQAWEYQPLGPFLAKNFASSISPWIVTPEALAPFRIAQPARPEGDPAPLPYLLDEADQARGGFDIDLEVLIHTEGLRAGGSGPQRVSRSNARHMYWTAAQLVAHHASNGCNLRPGDLLGSGTISSPESDGGGSLLELTEGGRRPIVLASGGTRTFLEDGDEVIMRARARRAGYVTIGLGEVRATIVSAPST